MSNAKETKETEEDKAKEMRTTASEIGTEEELPKPPQLKPKMFIAPIVLMGSKRLGIDWNDEDTKLKKPDALLVLTVCYLVIFYMYK